MLEKRVFFYSRLHSQSFQGGQPSYMKRGTLPEPNPVARPVLQGWQNHSGRINGTKSQSLFHTLGYHDQMYTVYVGSNWTF